LTCIDKIDLDIRFQQHQELCPGLNKSFVTFIQTRSLNRYKLMWITYQNSFSQKIYGVFVFKPEHITSSCKII